MRLATAQRLAFVGAVLALIAVAAYFQASGISRLVEATLTSGDKRLAIAPAVHPRAPAPVFSAADDHATSARWVLERNPFDSVTPRPLDARNGDRLSSINGFDVTSPETALEAYARLRTADHLTVLIQRHGRDESIDFNIQ